MFDESDEFVRTLATRGHEVEVALVGELDPSTVPVLEEHIDRLIADGARRVVLDLAALAFIDSSGLRALIREHKALAACDGELVLRSPSETTVRLLEITDLVSVFNIESSLR